MGSAASDVWEDHGGAAEGSVACPHASRCPGCPALALPYAAQLAAKAERVQRACAGYPELAGLAQEPVRATAQRSGYRTRAKLAVAAGARIGLYGRGGHEVLDLPQCRVLAPVLAQTLATLRRLLAAPPAAAGALLRAEDEGGRLRALDAREVVDERGAGVLLTLVVRAPEPSRAQLDAACQALRGAQPALRAIALSLHAGRSPQLLGAAPRVVWGAALHRELVRPGAPFAYAAPGSFAQAHRGQAAALHGAVEMALAPLAGRRLLELFSGSGALGLALAARGARVTLVEAFAPASQAAAQAAREQGLEARVRALAEPAEGAAARLLLAGERFGAALVNPPRRGLAPRLREALAALARDAIAYVSCEPATLARDLAHLARLGWRAASVTPFDLMPLTAEVECLALLRRAAPPPLALLHEDEDLLAVDKPPFLPTVPHPEHAHSLLARVRTLRDCAAAVALQRLDAETSGVCLFAKRPAAAAAWQRALAEAGARKRYLALVRGVGRARGRVARALHERGRVLAAATRYRRVEVLGGHALLEVTLETGRTHQIRRHLAAIGEPVLGDARHGHAASNRHLSERFFLDRPFLHCASVELMHPSRGTPLRIEAPLAPDLAAVLARLRAAAAPE